MRLLPLERLFLFDWCLIPKSEWDTAFDDLTPVKELFKIRHQVDWSSICLRDNANIQNQSHNIILRTATSSFGRGRNSQKDASFWQLDINDRVKILKTLSEIKFETLSRYIQVVQ